MCEVVPAWFYYGPLHLCWLMAVGPFNTWNVTSRGTDKMTTVFTQNDSFDNFEWSKGQLISKGLFGILNSSKKWTKKLCIMIPQVDLFLFIIWNNWRHTKIHFEINWPLVVILCICSACNYLSFSSQLEMSHVLNGPAAKNQHRCRGPIAIIIKLLVLGHCLL